ncbi:MAG: CoA-binding protein [Amycolatopsis sp.]|jgi:hypothetical protein|uniref:CoA-binding protein n=1 Tax=Amycolatopsis sp. TaxID=37632 RepID=UPI0026344962|nr:CoA-binding protein [Amycolatopsis sp.]MCU1686786.1 CoA-binding protein [Amycolatopsis sp.]
MSRTAEEILAGAKTIAVVGLSRDPDKAAHGVPAVLQAHGFRIIPVHPSATELLGISDATNPVLNGAFGTVKHSLIANGTTFTLNPADNPNVKGLLYLSTATQAIPTPSSSGLPVISPVDGLIVRCRRRWSRSRPCRCAASDR